jgi:hypothetical protein
MWKVWHGNLYGASIALNCFYDGVDIHIMISEKDSSRSTRLEQVRERLAELWSYLIANQTRLINYGRDLSLSVDLSGFKKFRFSVFTDISISAFHVNHDNHCYPQPKRAASQ